MKLYATITSERATKGQGGNKFIHIKLLAGDKHNPTNIAFISLEKLAGGYGLTFSPIKESGKAIFIPESLLKGKQQKGEKQNKIIESYGATDYFETC